MYGSNRVFREKKPSIWRQDGHPNEVCIAQVEIVGKPLPENFTMCKLPSDSLTDQSSAGEKGKMKSLSRPFKPGSPCLMEDRSKIRNVAWKNEDQRHRKDRDDFSLPARRKIGWIMST